MQKCAQKQHASNATFRCSIGFHLKHHLKHACEICKAFEYFKVKLYVLRIDSTGTCCHAVYHFLLLMQGCMYQHLYPIKRASNFLPATSNHVSNFVSCGLQAVKRCLLQFFCFGRYIRSLKQKIGLSLISYQFKLSASHRHSNRP